NVDRVFGTLKLRHALPVRCVAYRPGGKMLATGSDDGTVKLWDLYSGRELLSYTRHSEGVRALAFTRDGKMIASAGADRIVRIWDPDSGKDIKTLTGHNNSTVTVPFNPHPTTL